MISLELSTPNGDIKTVVGARTQAIQEQFISRCSEVSDALVERAREMLSHSGSGRVYYLPGGGSYQASAPGEVPAKRTGAYSGSFRPETQVIARGADFATVSMRAESDHAVNGYNLKSLLELGTSKMAPRPHVKKIADETKPEAIQILASPYY